MKPSEAAEIVMMLIAAYPTSKATPSTSAVYETSLSDLDVGVARKAVTRLIGTCEWMPTVAKIRAACADLERGPRRTGVEAYDELAQAVRGHGRCYGGEPAPEFADPLIARAIGVWGSWNDLCNSPSDDPGGRARFIELYDELARRERDDQVSGVALPRAAHAAPRIARAEAPLPSPAPVSLIRAMPRRQRPAEIIHRKYTAEELDHALRTTEGPRRNAARG